jgi:AcrR family transcriptional regulator
MYQLFDSKDELLAAGLERRRPSYAARLLPPQDDGRGARERISHVFEQLELQVRETDFHGCRYLNAEIELKDLNHPAREVARRVKDDLTGFFRSEAARGGATDPDLLSRQLILIFDGASARAGIGADTLTGLITPMVVALLDAADVH